MVTLSPLSESTVWHLGRGAWWEAPGSTVSIASGQESCLNPELGMGVEEGAPLGAGESTGRGVGEGHAGGSQGCIRVQRCARGRK